MKRRLIVLGIFVLPTLLNPLTWQRPVSSLLLMAAGFAGIALIVIVHEAGHAVVGVRQGLDLIWIAIGPVMFDLRRGRRPRRSPLGGAVGGFVAFDLGDLPDDKVAAALRRMSAGGPVASLLLAVVSLLFSTVGGSFTAVLFCIGGLSALAALSNAIPFRVGPLRSDGCTYLILWRGGEGAASLIRSARIAGLLTKPERPAQWPATLVERARGTVARIDVPSSAMLDEWLTASYTLYLHEIDRGEFAVAKGVLRRVADAPRARSVAKRGRYALLDTLTALHVALWEDDATTAAAILARIPKRSFVRRSTLWVGTEAAILLARGNPASAIKTACQAVRRLKPHADLTGASALEREWWQTVLARADAARGVATDRAAIRQVQIPSAMRRFGIAWRIYGYPGDICWLHRTPGLGAATRRRRSAADAVADRTGHAPRVSLPMAVLNTIAATTAVVAAILIAVTMLSMRLSGDDGGGFGLVAIGLLATVDLGIALWIGRQAGGRWRLFSLLLPLPALSLYIFRRNRGRMVPRATG